LSFLTRRSLRQAEALLKEGKADKAAALYARAGEYQKAAKLALEAGDGPHAVEWALRGSIGEVPDEVAKMGPAEAGETLAHKGQHRAAIVLFELSGAYPQAAESALQLHRPSLAARFYERAGMWLDAATCYERASQLEPALKALEQESQRLRQNRRSRLDAESEQQLKSVESRRARILTRLGGEVKPSARSQGLTSSSIDSFDHPADIENEIRRSLSNGDSERAARLLAKAPSTNRKLAAQVLLAVGRPNEAAHVFAEVGLNQEAAAAYEAGGDWSKAGSRWEAAQEHLRAAESYLKANRSRDAARCFVAAGKPLQAASCYIKSRDHHNAAAQYVKAGEPLMAASGLIAAGDRSAAAQVLMRIVPGDEDYEEASVMMIRLLIEQGMSEQALQRIHALQDSGSGQRDLLFLEAWALETALDLEGAERIYRKVLAVAPKHREAATHLSKVVSLRRESGLMPVVPPGEQDPTPSAPPKAEPPPAPAAPIAAAPPPPAIAEPAPPPPPVATPVAAPPPVTIAGATAVGAGAGQILADRYELVSELGRGGMGRVYKAFDRELGEHVAIKTLLGHPGDGNKDEERLLRELQICRRITHQNVVRVFDLGRFPNGVFITMELLEGERLDKYLERLNPLPLQRIRNLLVEVCAGLGAAHAAGIIHRDLKPGNIIVTKAGLKILDFGVARVAGVESHLTQTGFAVGSLLYMAPEQFRGGSTDQRTDLYALGVITHALITGKEPFDGDSAVEIALKHLRSDPPDAGAVRAELPASWKRLVRKLLAKNPDQRYQSVQELEEALAALPI
jgi:tetratricopeptide (TPR) repeat protein